MGCCDGIGGLTFVVLLAASDFASGFIIVLIIGVCRNACYNYGMSVCLVCGGALAPASRAIAPKYCSSACRQKAYRQRRKSVVPVEMRAECRWVRAIGKRPIRPNGRPASSTDPDTWASFEDVQAGVGDGFGFMLGDGFACWDFDHCFHDGLLDVSVFDLIDSMSGQLFMERSCSGEGLHVFVKSSEPSFRRSGVEFYSHARFIRMTGEAFAIR